jgi:hypothetical protein
MQELERQLVAVRGVRLAVDKAVEAVNADEYETAARELDAPITDLRVLVAAVSNGHRETATIDDDEPEPGPPVAHVDDEPEPGPPQAHGDELEPVIARQQRGDEQEPLPPIRHPQLGEPVATYRYLDIDGELVFVVARFEPKDFRQARLDGGRWRWDLNGTRRVLYRLPRLREALAAAETIYIVEGEKDVHAVEAAGAPATCNPQGAGKWSDELSEQLAGARRVRIVVDRDPDDKRGVDGLTPGERHALQVAESLGRAAGVASCDIELVVARAGKDAHDHLAAGHGLDELVPFTRPAAPGSLRVVSFAEFITTDEQTEAPLLGSDDKKLLPAGSNLVLYGEGGSGKTTLAIDMAVHLAAGTDWLGFAISKPVTVMLLENEGPRAEYRLKLRRKSDTWDGAAFADHVVVHEEPWGRIDLRDQEHVAALADVIRSRLIDVLVAGPIRRLGLEGGGTPAETVAVMRLLDNVREAAARPIAIALVHHENKGGDISGAFEAEFDTVVHVKADGRDRTALYFRKSRWSSRIHRARTTLAWAPETEGFTVVDTDIDAPRGTAERSAADTSALAWLVEHVAAHHAETGTPIPRGKLEEAFHVAHGGKGRNLARRIIKREIEAFQAHRNGEGTGEGIPALATCSGEVANGIYLIPFSHAPSPLAAPPTGEGGEHPFEPASEASARHLAAAPKGGEGQVASGSDPDLEAEIDRLEAIAREGEET